MDDFFRLKKKLGFRVFLVHPTVVSVLLSASVKRCFVSRMRDFVLIILKIADKSLIDEHIFGSVQFPSVYTSKYFFQLSVLFNLLSNTE